MALLFAQAGLEVDALSGFEAISLTEVTLRIEESPRHGAPMTMVRAGEERDIPAIAAIKLPRNLRAGPKLRPQIGHAIPRFGKCRSYLGHCQWSVVRCPWSVAIASAATDN